MVTQTLFSLTNRVRGCAFEKFARLREWPARSPEERSGWGGLGKKKAQQEHTQQEGRSGPEARRKSRVKKDSRLPEISGFAEEAAVAISAV